MFTVDIPCVLFVFIYDYWFKIGGGWVYCKIYSTLDFCGSASALNIDVGQCLIKIEVKKILDII